MRESLLNATKYLLTGVLLLLTIYFVLVFFPMSPIVPPEKNYGHLLIENINIVDVEKDTIYENWFVLVTDNRIERLDDQKIEINAQGRKIIDGSGKFLVPALWDMHVHQGKRAPLSAHAEFVVNGVMHVRDMRGAYDERDPFATTPSRIIGWNRQIKESSLLAPTTHNIPSLAVEGPHPMFKDSPEFFNCSDEREAERLVAYFEEQGVDMIKMYNNVPRTAFFELMEDANSAGIEVAGHKPVRVSTVEASQAGMKSLEHARFLIWDSFNGAKELRNSENPRSLDGTDMRERMLVGHDSVLLNDNLAALKNNRTWYCPTHMTRKSDAYAEDGIFRARYDSINPILRFLSFEDLDGTLLEDATDRGRRVYRDFYLKGLEISKKADEKGVKLLAGSDVPELPGTSLLDELDELSSAGLANYEILRTATLHPALYYDMADKYGSIEVGKIADMLILSHNPIAKISNLRSIDGLIYNGNYLDKGFIDRVGKTVRSRNNGIVMSAKLIWDVILYSIL